MRYRLLALCLLGLLLAVPAVAQEQAAPDSGNTMSSGGYTLSGTFGGGVTSSGGGFTLHGTVGQFNTEPDPITGSNFSLWGGLWPRIKALPDSPYDVNRDGFISPTDAIYVINRLGQTVDSSNQRADVDGDNNIDQADVQAILNRLGQPSN